MKFDLSRKHILNCEFLSSDRNYQGY